jgi:hypothetical protein
MLAAVSSDRFLTAFAADLIELELGPLPAELRDRATRWATTRIGGAGDVARLGLALTGRLIGTGILLRYGRAYRSLGEEHRRAVAARLAASGLPLVAEYVRAVRALAVSYVYDARYATAP